MGSLTSQHETMFSQNDIIPLTATLLAYFMPKWKTICCFQDCAIFQTIQSMREKYVQCFVSLCVLLICSPGLLNFSCPLLLSPSFVCEALGLGIMMD